MSVLKTGDSVIRKSDGKQGRIVDANYWYAYPIYTVYFTEDETTELYMTDSDIELDEPKIPLSKLREILSELVAKFAIEPLTMNIDQIVEYIKNKI